MKYRIKQNLVSQSVSQSVSHSLVDSKSRVKSENAVALC